MEHGRPCWCPLHEEQGPEARPLKRTDVGTPAGGTYKIRAIFQNLSLVLCGILTKNCAKKKHRSAFKTKELQAEKA